MAVTVVSFRWLEILEKEFDKNFVDLDLIIGDLDGEEPDLVYSARQKLAGLSSCFAQLTHKAQTIFQNSAKTEAELVDLRAELVQCRTKQEVLEEDCRNLVLQLHSLQLDRVPSNQNPEQYKEKIDNALKSSPSKGSYAEDCTQKQNAEVKRLRHELGQFVAENAALRTSVLALTSEVYGARLAAKYLDKELAGRIQQLQLLGKDMRTDVRDKLWRQLESEILLHRHKTVIRACRNRPHLDLLRPTRHFANAHINGNGNDDHTNNNNNNNNNNTSNNNVKPTVNGTGHEEEPPGMVGEKRLVVVRRQEGQGLGISITGGREHGVPILISELEEGGPAHECHNLFVGDAILSVDDVSLENASHFEAVKVLTSLQRDEVKLLVQFIAVDTDEETSLSEDLYGYRYRFFDTDVMDSTDVLGLHPVHADSAHIGLTPTAPRTPEGVRDDASGIWKPAPVETCSNPPDLFIMRESPKLIDISDDNIEKSPEHLEIELYGQHFRTDFVHSILDEPTPSPPLAAPVCSPLEPSMKIEEVQSLENNEKPLTPSIIKFNETPIEVRKEVKPVEEKEKRKVSHRSRQSPRTPISPKSPTRRMNKSQLLDCIDAAIFAGLDDTSMLDNIVKSFSEDDFSCMEAIGTSDSGLYSSDETKPITRPLPSLPSLDNSPEKLELRTLQQIFDRSFSSNLSSPHESTSFDDDIFSTEHSDEKNGNYLGDFRNKMNDMKNAYNPKKIQKFYPKNMDDFMKKPKRGLEQQKRTKNLRKKEGKTDKRRNAREDFDVGNRKTGCKVADRFEESLLEYSVRDADVEDALEATRKLSLQYGLRLPDGQPPISSPDRSIKVIEGHFKANMPVGPDKQEKIKTFRNTRYDSFGDPDFGTPV